MCHLVERVNHLLHHCTAKRSLRLSFFLFLGNFMMPIRIIKLLICWKGKFASLVVLQEENIGCGSFKHYVIAWREGNNHTFDDVDLLHVLCIFIFF